MHKQLYIASAVSISMLSGCTSFGPQALNVDNAELLDPGVRGSDVQTVADRIKEGTDIGNASPETYTHVGYNRVRAACSDYFDRLERYQNEVGYAGDVTSAAGGASATILNAAKSSAASIAAIAAGFSFTSSALSTYNTRALMTPYPSETKSLILSALQTFQDQNKPENMTSAVQAREAVQKFAELCTYSGITRAAKQALQNYNINSSSSQNGGAQYTTLSSSASKSLKLAETLTDSQLVQLYYYLYDPSKPWTDASLSQKIMANMPDDLVKLLKANVGANGPSDVTATLGSSLTDYYKSNSSFAKAVGDFAGSAKAVPKPPLAPVKNQPKNSNSSKKPNTKTKPAAQKAHPANAAEPPAVKVEPSSNDLKSAAQKAVRANSSTAFMVQQAPSSSGGTVGEFTFPKQTQQQPPPPPPPAPD